MFSRQLLGAWIVFVGAVAFSTKAVFVKLSYRYAVDAVSLLTLRMVFSVPFYLIIGFFQRNKEKSQPLLFKEWVSIAFLGLAGYYLASYFDFVGLQYITASIERLILFTYPTLVVLITALIYKTKITRTQIFALLLTYAGIIFAFINNVNLQDQENFYLGAIAVFISALTYAIYLVGSGRLIPKLGSVRYTANTMTFAGIGVFIHYLIVNDISHLFSFHPEVYYLSIMTAIISTVIPTFLISKGIDLIGSSNASIVGSVGPVSTVILAHIFLGEAYSFSQWVGTALVIAGVMVISFREKELY